MKEKKEKKETLSSVQWPVRWKPTQPPPNLPPLISPPPFEFLFHLLTYPLLRPLSAVLSINLYGFISWMSSPVKEGKEKVRKQRFQTKPYTSLCDCECGNWQTLCCATLCCVLCTVMGIHCVYGIYPVSHIARRQEFLKLEDKNTNTLSAVTL